MYAGIPNTVAYNLRKAKGGETELWRFKLKRGVSGSVDLRELPPVVTVCAAITKIKDEQRTRDTKKKNNTHVTNVYW